MASSSSTSGRHSTGGIASLGDHVTFVYDTDNRDSDTEGNDGLVTGEITDEGGQWEITEEARV